MMVDGSSPLNLGGGCRKTLHNKGLRTLHTLNLGDEFAPPKFGGYGLTRQVFGLSLLHRSIRVESKTHQ